MQLPDIDHAEDIKKFEAKAIKTELSFPHCEHRQIKMNKDRTELRCECGVAFGGSRLGELQALLSPLS